MRAELEGCAICVALVLATTAAIMSTRDPNDKTQALLEWLGSGFAPEESTLSGAIGARPDVFQAP